LASPFSTARAKAGGTSPARSTSKAGGLLPSCCTITWAGLLPSNGQRLAKTS
jgi:hypothetical protein